MKNNAKIVGSLTSLLTDMPKKSECDIVELRLDGDYDKDNYLKFCQSCPYDILITARDIKEGGITELSEAARSDRLREILPEAQYLDIEMRNWLTMSRLINEAKHQNIKTVASYHDFEKTPSISEIKSIIARQLELGSTDILKFAFMINSIDDLVTCQKVLFEHPNLTISIMGMGAYAPAARILLAQSGSILNYGYLGEVPTAPGQWPASLLKKAVTISTQINE